MRRKSGPISGAGLLAAGCVFVLAFFIREVNDEPAGAAAALAAICLVLGFKSLARPPRGRTTGERTAVEPSADESASGR